MKKIKYAAVGTGGRITMFVDPIAGRFSQTAELVGLCDISPTRSSYHQRRLTHEYGIPLVPTYTDFSLMLAEQSPDCVIVCTPDHIHHEFIVRSLDFGADVISEKPLTTDAEKCRLIFQAVERTGRNVRTTFNLRWTPGVTKVREIIAAGEIGEIKHVAFEYFLDTSHGADYFRRWHSQKEFSGGLLLHKSTHHFDLINWWIDGIPSLVFALGDLVFYGKANATRRGDDHWTSYARYAENFKPAQDPFHIDIKADPSLREIYYNAEGDSGYIRDRNVFREGIDIEDSMSLLIKYRNGAMVTYSLNAYSPREGFRASISGDRGRIEYEESHSAHIITGGASDGAIHSAQQPMRLTVQKHFSDAYEVEIPVLKGGHGGSDPLLQEQMFSPLAPVDSFGRNAGHEQGAASLLIGAAANKSIASNKAVTIDELMLLKPSALRLSELR